MDARNERIGSAKSKFYLVIARAFMAPTDVRVAAGMLCGNLTEELARLDREIGYGLDTEIESCQAEFDIIGDPDDLLLQYCSLFIRTPRGVKINVGAYLDGACHGVTARALESCYEASGVSCAGGLADVTDHVAMQLEFVAHLFSRAAAGPAPGQFIDSYPARWITPLIGDIRRAGMDLDFAGNPYLALAILLRKVLAYDAESKFDAFVDDAGKDLFCAAAPVIGKESNGVSMLYGACKR